MLIGMDGAGSELVDRMAGNAKGVYWGLFGCVAWMLGARFFESLFYGAGEAACIWMDGRKEGRGKTGWLVVQKKMILLFV